MGSPEPTYWTPLRITAWAAAAVAVSVWLGPRFVEAFRPPEKEVLDFSQEWLSARNFQAGIPVYAEQTETLLRHAGFVPNPGEHALPYNAHPPASILLALPFAPLSYRDAQFAWNLITFPLLVLAVVLVIQELGIPLSPWSVLPTVVLVLTCHPLYIQLTQGQLNAVLLLLIVLTWILDRRGWSGWAGVALGAATAIKLFPGFLFLYFLLTRRRAALVGGMVAFLAVTGTAVVLFGVDAFRTYAQEVVPRVAEYQTSWRNVSVSGFWLRVFNPADREGIIPVVRAPLVGRAIAVTFQVAITLMVAAVCWRAVGRGQQDRAFAVTLVGMLLVSPISWTHYYLLLPVPLSLLWLRLPDGPSRWAMWLVLVLMWLPDNFIAMLCLGPEQAAAMARNHHRPLSPIENLYAASVLHYILVGFFALTLLIPAGDDDEPVKPGRPQRPAFAASTAEPDEGRLNRRLFGSDDRP